MTDRPVKLSDLPPAHQRAVRAWLAIADAIAVRKAAQQRPGKAA